MNKDEETRRKENRERVEQRAVKKYVSKSKGECLPMETGDLTAIMNTIVKSTRRYGGKMQIYPPTPDGLLKFVKTSEEFFEYCNEVNADPGLEKKLIPDIEVWALYLGITRKSIFEYQKRNEDWAYAIEFFKNAIASAKKQLAFNYKIPPMVFAFDAANNHNYVNTSEFKITATKIVENSEQNQLEHELVQNGLVWDEETKSFEPMGIEDVNQ